MLYAVAPSLVEGRGAVPGVVENAAEMPGRSRLWADSGRDQREVVRR